MMRPTKVLNLRGVVYLMILFALGEAMKRLIFLVITLPVPLR